MKLDRTSRRFAATVIFVLALAGSSVPAALAAKTDAPVLQRAADRLATASGPSRAIAHATPLSGRARATSHFVMIDEPRNTAPFNVTHFVMIDEPRNTAPFDLPR